MDQCQSRHSSGPMLLHFASAVGRESVSVEMPEKADDGMDYGPGLIALRSLLGSRASVKEYEGKTYPSPSELKVDQVFAHPFVLGTSHAAATSGPLAAPPAGSELHRLP